jgi:ABC-type phosphate transport system substrate-binding protein
MRDDPGFDTIRRYEDVSGVSIWVAAIAGLLLVGFVIFATLNNNSNTASSDSSPPTTASRTATPPSTTGSGSSSPQPITPAPSKSGTQ